MSAFCQPAADYLADKRIKELLERIVVSLLGTRPEKPEQHIIKFLRNSLGDYEAWPTFHGAPSDAPVRVSGPATPTGRRSSVISQSILSGASASLRRNAFSAKVTSSTDVVIKTYPKDDATSASLTSIVKRVDLFSFLEDDQRRTLVGAMFPRNFADGSIIIRQGAQPDNFYILTAGQCRVLKRTGDTETQVCILHPGQYFGELALISGSTRAATVIAFGDVQTWAIDQMTYLGLLKEGHSKKRRRYHFLLKNVPLLKILTDYEIELVADALTPVNPQSGEVIIRQGEEGDDFYIILDGECQVFKANPVTNAPQDVGKLSAGGYFGELALMQDAPRAATIVAGQGCKLVRLQRGAFHRLLGPCNVFFTDNAKHYQAKTP
jgi:cAMP-dependent protein kinase regulator